LDPLQVVGRQRRFAAAIHKARGDDVPGDDVVDGLRGQAAVGVAAQSQSTCATLLRMETSPMHL
jgi:hypothetical protein